VRLSLPLSILLGSVIIALGLYFGLRVPTPAPTIAPPEGKAPGAPTRAAPPEHKAVAPLPPSAEQLQTHVAALVEGAKPRWKAACWDTADPAKRKPGRYVAGLAFDAAGRVTVSGVSEVRDASDPEVAQCIRVQVNEFQIPAPGRYVVFEIPFTMP
jgi:hypothetical protein